MKYKALLLTAALITIVPLGSLAAGTSLSAAKIEQLQRSAKLGYGAAQYELGLAYAAGDGVPQNLQLAVFWWQKAAENLDAAAQLQLGTAYAHGWGVQKNMDQAIYWWQKAAQDGDRAVAEQARLLLDQAA
ncbi:sel1 repeat family protein [Acidithiobacillus sp. CV18-2]|uniref:Sel1 repeat family protein n=1 Tax=Igneacidithiobacillus copahuensis TaxID=2724909 RepID=A0AAE3CKW0_9PROT|nr:SEL1-like repeat protein [Igneacidithiobacillus copahuensis]MBU2755732.1 sel1 repeat family protein [Acidithiobacillus sp. CV18-3]MBU2757075.1 sel1 repeat family protein [Acidithiobacillus sp. BN09-2]MBU2778551.1 sel1 repeat family protein [Acidithiobacillus sp. CV18-2]MBU2797677.1 sel1 repeat family protein [Acidithiobacillus sp. VAN18-2]MBU2798165.1 sel1 repeat family protein [Acidithiobacillus sp. VAN18-4]UTV82258.1 SEL1-like repeat protein [Acidithiobacillus sp. YTS05]